MIAGSGVLIIWYPRYDLLGGLAIDLFRAMFFWPLYFRKIALGTMCMWVFWHELIMSKSGETHPGCVRAGISGSANGGGRQYSLER